MKNNSIDIKKIYVRGCLISGTTALQNIFIMDNEKDFEDWF